MYDPVATAPGSDSVTVSKSNLHQRQNSIIALLAAFKLQQVIVSAALARRKLPAGKWPRIVDRTHTFDGIEKLAGFTENRIGFAPENALALPGRRETFLRGLEIHCKVPGQSLDITRGDLHALVDRTAIARTLRAVVVTSLSFW
jgi:hypothetical protein